MRKVYLIFVGVMALTFSIIGTLAAQGSEPPRPDALQAVLGKTIMYQGQLRKANSAVNGNCDMAFRLFNAAINGAQIGNPITTTVPVTNGLFTVGLDFGAAAFTGEERWLEIGVKCAGDGVFTTLTPRQSIAPAPYALALPGLRTEQNSSSPNAIGGYSANTITPTGVSAAVIGGGGRGFNSNMVSDDLGVVGGGSGNVAGNLDSNNRNAESATVSGGLRNVASGPRSTVGGGQENTASDTLSTISGGGGNTANGIDSTVGGGLGNTANGAESIVGGGRSNAALGIQSTVAGGRGNTASGIDSIVGGGRSNFANGVESTVVGGFSNIADNVDATIGGGQFNIANGQGSTIPGGSGALASHDGEMAYASGQFSDFGDAQTSIYVLRTTIPNNQSSRELFLDGSISRLTITNTRTLAFDILIVARSNNGKSAGWRYQGVIENNGGTTAFVGTPIKTTLGEDDPVWDVDLVAGNTSDSLIIRGYSNSSGDNIRFVATVRTVEVSY